MKPFMDENFLLQTDTAQRLYHDFASGMPIFDYHCHISPQEIAEDRRFNNLTEIWLHGDHYKWRAMRANGVDEKFITGNSSDREKFQKWAETAPYTMRNPLYHWTHLELRHPFGIKSLLSPSTAGQIWDTCNELLQTNDFSCRGIIRKSNVKVICTTDDPVDSLEYHRIIKESDFDVKVIPAWRPDKAMMIEDPESFNKYVGLLEGASDISITSFDQFMAAIDKRHLFFHQNGCRLSDHGLETMYAAPYTATEISAIFDKVRTGETPSLEDILKFKSAMLYEFAVLDHSRNWTQQYHLGAMRNNNTRMFGLLGADKGYDSIGDYPMATALSKFLNRLELDRKLTRTILYNLNPGDNEVMATMTGNFQDGSEPGKIQWGSSWWFLDQKDGMINQMNTLSNLGLLSRFIGMLTDSRSFLSYSRHEYFRRILCNLIGTDVENGEIPSDIEFLGQMVQNISYNNAAGYFRF
ncbi:MAG: glucuronate isomerase [Mariniphaga sp.]